MHGGPAVFPGIEIPAGITVGKWRIMVDGVRYGDDTDAACLPVFAPNGKHFAFRFLQGDKMNIAFDDEDLPAAEYAFVGRPAFDRKGATIAFVSNDGRNDPATRLHRRGEQWVDGGTWSLHLRKRNAAVETIVEDAKGVLYPTFGPGGLAYALLRNGQWQIVVGDVVSDPFDEVGPPSWSKRGTRVEFGARSGRELWWRVLDLK